MECPNCGLDDAVLMYEDPIPCTECNSIIKIKYCVCPNCNYSFRLANDMFLDGAVVDYELLDDTLENLMEAMDQEDFEDYTDEGIDRIFAPENEESLTALIHNCIRCGSPTVYKKSAYEYKCPECGMEWEILGDEDNVF